MKDVVVNLKIGFNNEALNIFLTPENMKQHAITQNKGVLPITNVDRKTMIIKGEQIALYLKRSLIRKENLNY